MGKNVEGHVDERMMNYGKGCGAKRARFDKPRFSAVFFLLQAGRLTEFFLNNNKNMTLNGNYLL